MGKKWSKMTKNSVHHALYLRNHTSYDCHLRYMCKMIISPGFFFIFSKFRFFELLGGKRTKSSPKWQKILSVTYTISQEPYILWLSFMVKLFFHFLKILVFWVVRGVKKGKKWSKMTKKSVCCAWYLRNHTSYDYHLSYICVKR